jgi:two-component system LytT family response regulator
MAHPIKILIVDDERLARRELIALLAPFHSIQIIGEAEDVPSALQAIAVHTPDAIFLDIQMPAQSGFDLVESLPPSMRFVFVTAYDEYAIRAFDVNALDYLLKPIHPERLRLAVERLCGGVPTDSANNRLAYEDRLFLLLNTHYRFLKIADIICIAAAGDYSEVMTTDGGKGLASKTLREWEARLPEQHFCRIHRSIMINLNYVDRTEETASHGFRVFLRGMAEPLSVSRRFAALLKSRFR